MRRRTLVAGAGAGALVIGVGGRAWTRWRALPVARVGWFANGMEYIRWGDGPKTLLWLPGGPGSELPRGAFARLVAARLRPFLDDGFSVWRLSRRRHMPVGHTVADMADDVARLIEDEFGGRVDLVVGLSYGGLIAQYLAADHADRSDHVVVALAAGRVSDWGRQLDRAWAEARAAHRHTEAGTAMAAFFFPADRQARLRRLVGPLLGRLFAHEQVASGDLRVEAAAETAFDAREVLPRIRVPVLLVCAERDRFFPKELVDETTALIPGCTVVRYPGMGHARAAMSGRLPRDILDFVHRTRSGGAATGPAHSAG